ncbi:MAG: PH domain-containing protein [Bdellovibrionota bacterium]
MEEPLRTQIPLQKRKILKKTFNSLIKIVVFCLLVSGFMYSCLAGEMGSVPDRIAEHKVLVVFGWILVMAALIAGRLVYQILYFITYFYDMDEHNVVIRKGVLTKREITLPFSKITDVYVDQDIADVALGLYDVHISTPTVESGVFAHIDGVNKAGSVRIRKMVLDAVNRASNPTYRTNKDVTEEA